MGRFAALFRRLAVLALAAVPQLGGTGAHAEPPPAVQRFEQGGVSIEFSLRPAAGASELRGGADALARLRLTDARSHAPLEGGRPRAWITRRRGGEPDEAACADRIRAQLGGALANQADANLNSYLILTLNHDRTVAMINPQVAFSATKLETVVTLPAQGADWVLSRDRRLLYVSLPEAGAVAVVDTVGRRLVDTVATGEGTAPTRLAMQPDGRQLWAGLDASGQVAVIDTASRRLAARVDAGAGLHSIAFTADSRQAYVANSAQNSVSVFDTASRAKLADIPVPGTPVAVAYGAASRSVLVAALNAEAITVIDADEHRIARTIPARRGNVAIGFEPLGRWALAVNQLDSTVAAIDSATGRTAAVLDVVKEPDQIAFTRRYAYVRGLQSEKFSLISLGELKDGAAAPVHIQAGTLAPAALPGEIGPGPMIVPTPDGDSVLVANAPDSAIYHYDEGMMAPTGSFSNYKRLPRALLVLDRSLEEVAPGEFSAPVRLAAGGRFDVPVLIDRPRITHCFTVEVADAGGGPARSLGALRVEPSVPADIQAGRPSTFAVRLLDPATGAPAGGVRELDVLVFRPPGTWQQRLAVPAAGDEFRFTLTLPVAGEYEMLFAAPSHGPRTAGPPPITVVARGEAEAPVQAPQAP